MSYRFRTTLYFCGDREDARRTTAILLPLASQDEPFQPLSAGSIRGLFIFNERLHRFSEDVDRMSRQDPGHFARIKRILGELHELGDADRREYLDEVCRDDPELRAEIESLLSHEQDPSLARPAPADAGETAFSTPVVEPAPLHATEPGAVLAGRYRIDAFLAAGGMGQVYRAHDLELDVPIALKTIRPEIASHPTSLRLFKQEVLLARSITHSNVCRIFDLRRDDSTGVVFLTMEFLPGETLMSRIKKSGTFLTDDSLPLARQMADALDAAHRAGIVHRDFKSPNVMLVPSDGCDKPNGERAVITDFGLAITLEVDDEGDDADVDDDVQDPRSDMPSDLADDDARTVEVRGPGVPSQHRRPIVGTPAYMAPEQVAGDRVGPAADLYAFGVVLFEMCTGQLPFREATPMDTARAHITSPPPRPGTLAIVDESWEEAILRLLSKDPDDRYATADEAVLALEGRTNGTAKVPHALPPERDIFVGRVEELKRLAELLEPDTDDSSQAVRHPATTRLVTMLGLGGTGKSRLVQKYGWDSLLRWPGGVWFCDLSEAKTGKGIARAVAVALNVSLGREDPIVQLGHAIASRGRALVILDNFEQVVDCAEATLGRWLERATETSFLVTSRERLRLRKETTYELEPLDPATRGLELFEVRAWAHRPGFLVDPSNQKLIEGIVEKLDGLPLAIELAASRLRNMDPEQLRAGLEDRFRLLVGKKRGRHATLEATLDWSWDLLEPWEQSAIAQASAFEGGFTLDAAEAVIDLSPYEKKPFVLDVIQSLVDKSWLRAKVAQQALRFSMYATIQEYARAKLPSSSGAESRHGAYFATMGTAEAMTNLDVHGGVARRAGLRLELDNTAAACRRAIEQHDELVATNTYVAFDEVLRTQGPIAPSIELGPEVLLVVSSPSLRGRALLALARGNSIAGNSETACHHFEEALATFRDLGDRGSVAMVLGYLSRELENLGQREKAFECVEAGLAISREIGSLHTEAVMLGYQGLLHLKQGRTEPAFESLGTALAMSRELGHRRSEGTLLTNLGILHADHHRFDESVHHFEEALAIQREVGDRNQEGLIQGCLGRSYLDEGRLDEARPCLESALALYRELGNRRDEGVALAGLAGLCYYLTRFDEAGRLFESALMIHREVGDQQFEGVACFNLGACHLGAGRTDEAYVHYEAALAVHRKLDNRASEGHALEAIADLSVRKGRLEEAQAQLEAALVIARELGIRRLEGKALGALGSLYVRKGHLEDARPHLEKSVEILRESHSLVDLRIQLCALGHLELQAGNYAAARTAMQELESGFTDVDMELGPELGSRIEALRQALADSGA